MHHHAVLRAKPPSALASTAATISTIAPSTKAPISTGREAQEGSGRRAVVHQESPGRGAGRPDLVGAVRSGGGCRARSSCVGARRGRAPRSAHRKQASSHSRRHHHGHAERRARSRGISASRRAGASGSSPAEGLSRKSSGASAHSARDGGALAHAAAEFGGQALEAAVQPDQREPEARLQRQLGLVERPAQPAVVVAQALALREHQVRRRSSSFHSAPARNITPRRRRQGAGAPARRHRSGPRPEQDAPVMPASQPDHVAQQRALPQPLPPMIARICRGAPRSPGPAG